jgi:hypothetical protein
MGTAVKQKEVKKSGTRFLDIKRRSRDLSRLCKPALIAKEQEDRVVRRMCGLVVAEATWLCEVLNRAKLKLEEDKVQFKDIQKHIADLHDAFPDEIERNLFIPETDVRIVTDMAWLVAKIEELDVVPKNEKPKEETLEDDGDE